LIEVTLVNRLVDPPRDDKIIRHVCRNPREFPRCLNPTGLRFEKSPLAARVEAESGEISSARSMAAARVVKAPQIDVKLRRRYCRAVGSPAESSSERLS